MTREPLMLSDTAMVLLRQYSELDDDYWAFRTILEKEQRLEPRPEQWVGWSAWSPMERINSLRSQIQWELMQEIWLLWVFYDVSLMRYLEWHLVFNAPLMVMAEKTFIDPHEYPRGNIRFITRKPNETTWFLETLETAYKKGLAAHKKDCS